MSASKVTIYKDGSGDVQFKSGGVDIEELTATTITTPYASKVAPIITESDPTIVFSDTIKLTASAAILFDVSECNVSIARDGDKVYISTTAV